jgi:aminopeptidase N
MPAIEYTRFSRHYLEPNLDFVDPNVSEQYPPDIELEPIHLNIDLQVDIANQSLSGTVTTVVKARHQGPDKLTLDAVDFLDITAVDPEGHQLHWDYDGKKLNIIWTDPFDAGEERQIAITYRVVQPVDGLYFSQPNESYPDQTWYAATDHETERARHWLPCIDLPNVRTTLEFQLRADERFTILANGLLVKEIAHGDGTKTAHWKLEQLCPSYLVCFVIGDLIRADDGFFDDGDKRIELAYFCTPEHEPDHLRRTFGRTRAMMDWMTKKLAMPFPYPKYYQFALPAMGGAMENISLVSWSDSYVLDEETFKELGWIIDTVNVHEMAHSYFGDTVVVRDFAHAWLKESWATYMEQCWCEDNTSQDEAQYIFYDHATAYFREADEKYMRPIVTRRFKSSWQMYDRHLYPGGACRLHTLRNELGDDIFWPAVGDYLRRNAGKVVETDDFRHVLEEHSGRSLGKFFDQWFHSPGYPDLKISFKYEAKQQRGVFEIEQKQVDKEKGIPAFNVATELGWTINGEERRLPIKITEAKHTFMVSMAAEPEQVRFDPDNKVLAKLSFNPGDPMLRRQLSEAKDVIGRVLAAHELAKTGKRANVEAIVDAYENESFWGVKEQFLKTLAEADTEAAIAGLESLIKKEEEPLVLPTVFRCAGKFRDPGLRDAIALRLGGNLAPVAQQAAYEAMGAQRNDALWDVLVQGSQEVGYNGISQSGAFKGLGATRREEAVDLLLEQIDYGIHSNRVRPAIVSALADIGQGLERMKREQVVETLSDLLRDPWRDVRWQAASGLRKMNAPQAIPTLEAFRRSVSQQEQVYIEQLIESLRNADKIDGSAMKKQVEDLRDKVRKLEDQLQKVEARLNQEGSQD